MVRANLLEEVKDYENSDLLELAKEFRSGDEEAFNQILRLTESVRTGIAKKLGRQNRDPRISQDDVDTMVLDATFNAANYSSTTNFLGFIKRNATMQVIDEYRRLNGRTGQHRPKFRSLFSLNEEELQLEGILGELDDTPAIEFDDAIIKVSNVLENLSLEEKRLVYLRYSLATPLQDLGKQVGTTQIEAREILDRINQTLRERLSDMDIESRVLSEMIRDQLAPTIHLEQRYQQYQMGEIAKSPITILTPASIPIVREAIYDVFNSRLNNPRHELNRRGLNVVINNCRGLKGLVSQVTPEIAHKMTFGNKWTCGELSEEFALKLIQESLYSIPGYKDAEASGNEKSIADIINRFIRKTVTLKEFFREGNLNGLMHRYHDPKGINGLETKDSPKAVIKFYFQKKFPHLLDRENPDYIQMWRFKEVNKHNRGEESIQTFIDGFSDFLRQFGGYRQAEDKRDYFMQTEILNKAIKNHEISEKTMKEFGLIPLIKGLYRSTGNLRKISARAGLEFYFNRTAPELLERDNESYLQLWRVTEDRQWLGKEASRDLSILAIQDFLREIPGYRQAEDSDNRNLQLEILDKELIGKYGGLFAYMNKPEFGLNGMMCCFYDPTGEFGFRKKQSAYETLDYYCRNKGLGWFNENLFPHIEVIGPHQKLRVVYQKKPALYLPDSHLSVAT